MLSFYEIKSFTRALRNTDHEVSVPKCPGKWLYFTNQGQLIQINYINTGGWSGGAMVLGKLSVPGRPTIWISVGQGPAALAVGAGGGVWTFLLSSILSLLFLPLFGRRPDID